MVLPPDLRREFARLSRRRALLAALVLALLGAVVAFGLARTSATDFVAGAASRLLGRAVELRAIDVRLGGRLEIELVDLRVAGDDPNVPLFEAPIARFHQSWSRLLTGRILPMAWSFERPILRLRASATPGEGVGLPRMPPLELSIEDGTVLFEPRQGPPLRLERLRVTAQQAPLRAGVRGSALGGIARGERTAGDFAIDFDGWLDDAELRGSVEGLPLDALPWPSPAVAPRAGEASGSFALALGARAFSGALDVSIAGFRHDIPEGRPLVPRDMRVVADGTWKDGRLGVTVHPLRVDDVAISGGVTIDTRPGGRVRGRLEAAPFETRPGTRLNLLRVLGLRFETFAEFDQRISSGRIDEIRAELDLPTAEFARSVSLERETPPEELHVHARVRGVTYRARPHMSPIEELEGEFDWEGDRMRFSHVRMVRDEKPLPEINVTVDGARIFTHLPREERKLPETPGVPLHGLGPAFASFRPDPTEPPRDTVITVRQAHVAYSGFLLPFRDGEIVLRFPEGNVQVERADGVLGGALATLEALWDRARDRIDVRVRFREGDAPPRRDLGPFWVGGEFSLPHARFGRWPLDDVRGRLRASRALVELSDVTARLSGGAFASRGHLSLEPEDHAPFALTVELSGADAAGIGEVLKFAPGSLSGTVATRGTLAGKLRPEHKVLEDGEVDLALDVRDGTLANLPLLLAVARFASPLGWTGLFGRPLPYTRMQADLTIRGGKLRTENFALDGPELRMLAAGEIDLLPEETPLDMVIALLFLRTVDQVLERVPLVGSFLLGENKSLVTLYFKVNGPWKDPGGMPLPPQGIASAAGWAGRVLGEGVRRIRDMLVVPAAGAPAPQPAPSPDPAKKERSDGAAREAQDPRT
jgi:hypothetical protein